MSKVSVVILNYNGQEYLKQFLPILIKNTPNARLIVADNCSTDNSITVLDTFSNDIEIIRLSKNYGYAGGYNEALKQIDSEYYLLLNSDVEVSPNWLDPLVDFLATNIKYAAVQPKILDFNNRNKFEYAGACGGFIDMLGYPYCRGRVFDTVEFDECQYDTNIDVDWCSGACFLIRAEHFHSNKGFNSDYFAHMEEIDLCWRILNKGNKLACIPKSIVYHVGGGTLNKTSPNKTFLNFRNNLTTLARNLPIWKLTLILPFRVILDLISSIKFARDQSLEHFKAVIKAEIEFFSSLGKTIKNRERSARFFHGKKILLIHYYFLNNKTFKKINNTK